MRPRRRGARGSACFQVRERAADAAGMEDERVLLERYLTAAQARKLADVLVALGLAAVYMVMTIVGFLTPGS